MNVEYINPFLTSAISAFDTMADCELRRGTPYVKNGSQPEHEVSGVIGLSGQAQGISDGYTERQANRQTAEQYDHGFTLGGLNLTAGVRE